MVPSVDDNSKVSFLFGRRHLLLLAAIALSTPFFFQSVLGAPGVTTEQAMELLGHKADHRSHHDIVHSTSDSGVLRLKVSSNENTISIADVPNKWTGDYPLKDKVPDIDHPQVKAWLAEIDWTKVPDIPVANSRPDSDHFPECSKDDDANSKACWYSCGGCIHETDMVSCPNTDDWGLTYDDGPNPATTDMMAHLKEKGATATFFIVGSRVLEYPDILKEEVAQGHHIASHTWSHSGLTTLTNEQIVAEIRWSEKIIRDVTGLSVKYIRPPYGDVDNRVREILRQMGYTTVIWTLGWDTNDWRVAFKQIKSSEVIESFKNALNNRPLVKSPQGIPAGPITLQHDINVDTIEISKQVLPLGMAEGLKPMSLAQCMGDSSPYQSASSSSQQPKANPTTDKAAAATKSTAKSAAPTTPTSKNAGAGADTKPSGPAPVPDSSKDSATHDSTPDNEGSIKKGASKSKSDARSFYQNGIQAFGIAAMGLTAVASYMLTF
ncbi:chitin deacetylase [Entomortierella lignicola]|nr:chitin deacetylase [Entomortierella lignicola]